MQKNLFIILMLTILSGCMHANNVRGPLENNVYFSLKDPNIRIEISNEYLYRKGGNGKMMHQYINKEDGKYIYLHFARHMTDETRVIHYFPPIGWIFNEIPGSKEINKGTMKVLEETWYYRNSIVQKEDWCTFVQKEDWCTFVRDTATFTQKHDIFKIIYVKKMPAKECQAIDYSDEDNLKNLIETFISDFSKDVVITNYDSEKNYELSLHF